jgi:hypothetical protein
MRRIKECDRSRTAGYVSAAGVYQQKNVIDHGNASVSGRVSKEVVEAARESLVIGQA